MNTLGEAILKALGDQCGDLAVSIDWEQLLRVSLEEEAYCLGSVLGPLIF